MIPFISRVCVFLCRFKSSANLVLVWLLTQCSMNAIGFGTLKLENGRRTLYDGCYEIRLGSDKTVARKLRVKFFALTPPGKEDEDSRVIFDRTYLIYSDLGNISRTTDCARSQTKIQVKDRDGAVVFSCVYGLVEGQITELEIEPTKAPCHHPAKSWFTRSTP